MVLAKQQVIGLDENNPRRLGSKNVQTGGKLGNIDVFCVQVLIGEQPDSIPLNLVFRGAWYIRNIAVAAILLTPGKPVSLYWLALWMTCYSR